LLGSKRQLTEWSKIKDPVINPCNYSHVIFDKETQNMQWRKDSLFNKCHWKNWMSACRGLKVYPCLSPCTNINSKWIKDLYVRSKVLKLLQEVVGNTQEHIGIGNNFLNRTPMI
jgi:hypothetical protein